MMTKKRCLRPSRGLRTETKNKEEGEEEVEGQSRRQIFSEHHYQYGPRTDNTSLNLELRLKIFFWKSQFENRCGLKQINILSNLVFN